MKELVHPRLDIRELGNISSLQTLKTKNETQLTGGSLIRECFGETQI